MVSWVKIKGPAGCLSPVRSPSGPARDPEHDFPTAMALSRRRLAGVLEGTLCPTYVKHTQGAQIRKPVTSNDSVQNGGGDSLPTRLRLLFYASMAWFTAHVSRDLATPLEVPDSHHVGTTTPGTDPNWLGRAAVLKFQPLEFDFSSHLIAPVRVDAKNEVLASCICERVSSYCNKRHPYYNPFSITLHSLWSSPSSTIYLPSCWGTRGTGHGVAGRGTQDAGHRYSRPSRTPIHVISPDARQGPLPFFPPLFAATRMHCNLYTLTHCLSEYYNSKISCECIRNRSSTVFSYFFIFFFQFAS